MEKWPCGDYFSCMWHMYVEQGTVADHIITIVATIKNQSSTAQSPTDIVNTYCSLINACCVEGSLGALQHSKQIKLFLYTPICPLLEWLPLACFEALPSFIKKHHFTVKGRAVVKRTAVCACAKLTIFFIATHDTTILVSTSLQSKKKVRFSSWPQSQISNNMTLVPWTSRALWVLQE